MIERSYSSTSRPTNETHKQILDASAIWTLQLSLSPNCHRHPLCILACSTLDLPVCSWAWSSPHHASCFLILFNGMKLRAQEILKLRCFLKLLTCKSCVSFLSFLFLQLRDEAEAPWFESTCWHDQTDEALQNSALEGRWSSGRWAIWIKNWWGKWGKVIKHILLRSKC